MPPSLFGYEIPRLVAIQRCGKVNVENTSEAKYYVDSSGKHWVGKDYVDTAIEPILAEAIAWPLAKELGVRTPDVAVFGRLEDDTLVWLSEYIPASLHWQREHAAFISNTGEFGAMLALDAMVLNEDRHAKNILLTPGNGHESELVAWSIDMGNAVVGCPGDFAARQDEVPSLRNLARGIPARAAWAGALAAAELAKSLASSAHLENYVAAACALVKEPSGAAILATLRHRLTTADALVARYLSEIEGVK